MNVRELTLDARQTVTFASAAFSADAESRTVSGVILPFGVVGANAVGRFRFEAGSVELPPAAQVSRVKLNRDHVRTALAGVATALESTPEGITGSFRLGQDATGTDALTLAADGILDGFSAEVTITDWVADPADSDVVLVRAAQLTGVALTGAPAFDDARVQRVAASASSTEFPNTPDALEGTTMTTPVTPAEGTPAPVELSAGPIPVPLRVDSVSEALPYSFDRAGKFVAGAHEFSSDLISAARAGDLEFSTPAGRRARAALEVAFAVVSSDVASVTPSRERPDLYVSLKDYRTPIFDAINSGTLTDGVPFIVPKYNASSGQVADHTEGVEPTPGSYSTTSQTVTPTAVSGVASITREVFNAGGNPVVSNLIMSDIARSYREGLETAAGAFIGTLTAAVDIALTAGAADAVLAGELEAAFAGLAFARGYDFAVILAEQGLYKALAGAKDDNGRALYPIIGASNANGTASARLRELDIAGVKATPAWALAYSAGAENSSWLLDPERVHGWASAPQRIELANTVATVNFGVFGYKAFACRDLGAVRQVRYDATA